MNPIRLSELIEAVEFDSDEHASLVDLQDGRAVRISHSLLRAVEEGDEDALEGLADWEKEEAEVARAVAADSGERFIAAPDKFEFHEYRQMERFIRTVGDAEAADQLWRAIKGKGAFRYFKDTAHRLGLLPKWYLYRDEAMKQYVLDWAEAHGVPITDDTRRQANS